MPLSSLEIAWNPLALSVRLAESLSFCVSRLTCHAGQTQDEKTQLVYNTFIGT